MKTWKRKADTENDPEDVHYPSSGIKKLKLGGQAVIMTHLPFGADRARDEHQPARNDIEELSQALEDASYTPRLKQQRPCRRLITTFNDKQRLLDRQVTFAILARDNNKPEPHGQRSSTYGPLTWSPVANAHNQTIRAGQSAVGLAAMHKRARQHREAWMAARPEYPRKIMYMGKVEDAKFKGPCGMKRNQVPQVIEMVRQDKVDAKDKANTINCRRVSKPLRTTLHVSGWVPPDDIPNAVDLDIYIKTRSPVSEDEQAEQMVIEVENADKQLLGDILVRVKSICHSSKWASEEHLYNTGIRLKLTCRSKAAVDR